MSTVAEQSTIAQPSPASGASPSTVSPSEPFAQRPKRPPEPIEPREDRPYSITADVFQAMIEAEIFPGETRVYLQDGRIYEKMAKTQAHSIAGGLLVDTLVRRIARPYWVLPEGEFRVDDWNSKLPDIAIIRCDNLQARLASGPPLTAGDIVLAVEIAVTSLSKDLGENLERYARAMIPNYWVADVTGRRLLAHSNPRIVDGIGIYGTFEIAVTGKTVDLGLAGQEAVRFAFEDLML